MRREQRLDGQRVRAALLERDTLALALAHALALRRRHVQVRHASCSRALLARAERAACRRELLLPLPPLTALAPVPAADS